jgi:hypothetical protein
MQGEFSFRSTAMDGFFLLIIGLQNGPLIWVCFSFRLLLFCVCGASLDTPLAAASGRCSYFLRFQE